MGALSSSDDTIMAEAIKPNKMDQAVKSLERDLMAEVNALPLDELKQLAIKSLRLKYYDRARSNTYNQSNREKRRQYYHAVTKGKRQAKRLAGRLGDTNQPEENRESREEPMSPEEPMSREKQLSREEPMDI